MANEIPLGKLFAYQAWSMENDPWREVVRDIDGYIAQEVAKRLGSHSHGGQIEKNI